MINRRDFLISTGIGILAANQIVHGRDDDFLKLASTEQVIKDSRVGKGLDTVLDEHKYRIFKPTFDKITFPQYSEADIFRFDISSSQSAFTRLTSISAKGSGSYGLAKAKASASVKNFFNSNSYSCHIVGYIRKVSNPYEAIDINVLPDIKKIVRKNINNPVESERRLGDAVITGFRVAAEIIVIAEFQAESEQKKREIAAKLSGSYAGASGSAKFSEAVNSIKNSSNASIRIMGHIPDSEPKLTTENAVIDILNNFNSKYQEKLKISNYIIERYSTINDLSSFPNFVDEENILLRNDFASDLNSLYQTYEDWGADIAYVLDDITRGQFDKEVIDKAEADKEICDDDLKKMEALDRASLIAWKKDKNWKAFFDPKRLDTFRKTLPTYKQKAAPTPPAPRARRPKVPIERRGGNDHGIGGRQ